MEAILKINNQEFPVELTLGQVAQINKAAINYTDITSFEAACEYNGVDPVEFEKKYSSLPKHIYAQLKLEEIVKAINGGEVQDYSDTNVWKHYPWFNSVGSSSGFSFGGVGCGYAYSVDVSRLLYKTEEGAEHGGRTFVDLYNDLING